MFLVIKKLNLIRLLTLDLLCVSKQWPCVSSESRLRQAGPGDGASRARKHYQHVLIYVRFVFEYCNRRPRCELSLALPGYYTWRLHCRTDRAGTTFVNLTGDESLVILLS